MVSAILRGGLPSARAIVIATFEAISPWAGSLGASTPIVGGVDERLPSARARSIAALRIETTISFIGTVRPEQSCQIEATLLRREEDRNPQIAQIQKKPLARVRGASA